MVRFLLAVCLLTLLPVSSPAAPLVARFSTIAGDFDVLLNSEAAPVTVANFSRYAQAGLYDGTFIHRSTTSTPFDAQIIQGGSFGIEGESLFAVPLFDPIPLEAGLSNARGTIAMAREAAPDSARASWFLNIEDNPGLDAGVIGDGYAVFGRVLGSGMENVVDLLASVPTQNFGGAFSQLPLLPGGYVLEVFQVDVVPFRVSEIRREAGGCRIDWTPLSTNTPVAVERATNLVTGGWTVVSSNNTSGTFTDPVPPAGAAFYRVVLP